MAIALRTPPTMDIPLRLKIVVSDLKCFRSLKNTHVYKRSGASVVHGPNPFHIRQDGSSEDDEEEKAQIQCPYGHRTRSEASRHLRRLGYGRKMENKFKR